MVNSCQVPMTITEPLECDMEGKVTVALEHDD